MGTIPRDALEQIKARAQFSVARINEIEKTTNHDVIAFTTNLAESMWLEDLGFRFIEMVYRPRLTPIPALQTLMSELEEA